MADVRSHGANRPRTFALAVAAIMILGAFGAGMLASPGSPSAPPSAAGVSPVAPAVAPSAPSALAASSSVGGACHLSDTPGTAAPSAPAGASPDAARGDGGPLYNSQVEPYASFTGPYAYVAGGAAVRDQGYGNITLTWPDDDPVVQAYLVWSIMDNATPPDYGTLNGGVLAGTWTAYATPSPCWSPIYIYTFVADVTGQVVNGVNSLTGFPSGVTNGLDPWAEPQTSPMDEGATLVVIYSADTASTQEVILYTGALTSGGQDLSGQLNYSTTNSPHATTTYIVADGQLPDNPAGWNGSVIDANAFPGSAPRSSAASWSYGNLWDTDTFDVNVGVGGNNTSAEVGSSGEDCLTWIAQVVSVGVPALPGPYAVDVEEQGLPLGTEWNLTVNDVEQTGTVTDAGSSIDNLLANGTYPYTIEPLPGWIAQYKGSFTVSGGPLFLRVAFHPAEYTVTFTETGLPAKTIWTVVLTNTSQEIDLHLDAGAPAPLFAQAMNGSYDFVAETDTLYTAHPMTGTIVVASGPESQLITFVPPTLYNVTFVQQGLPTGTTWGGDLETNWGYPTESTSARNFTVFLPNVSAGGDHLVPSPESGFSVPPYVSFGVFGANRTIDVNFTKLYSVNLIESGLPIDTQWHGNLTGLSGTVYGYSGNATITFTAVNGSYTFAISHLWGYDVVPAAGPVTVDGANATVRVTFSVAPLYALTLTEHGLPAGTSWSLELYPPGLGPVEESSTTTTIALTEPNGSYQLRLTALTGYQGTPSYTSVVIDGAPASQAFRFAPLYSVSLKETGLPSGTYWYGYINGTYEEVDAPVMSIEVTNGTIPFQLYDIDSFVPTPISGSAVVDGANAVQDIVFASPTLPTYAVTISETGLPTGTNWSAELNDYVASTTGTSLGFLEDNGSYFFYAYAELGYTPDPQDGYVDVAGGPASQAVVYTLSAPTYTVTFTEAGLPDEAAWDVTFDEQMQESSSTTDVFTVPDGDYSYTVATAEGYTPLPASGSVTVDGEDAGVSVTFTAPATEYTVTFTETGLPSETTWWVNLTDGTPTSSSTTTIVEMLLDGEYRYTASADDHRYSAAGGAVTVEGSDVSVTVHFSTGSAGASSPGLLGLPGSDGYVVLGAIGAALLFCLFFAIARRRRKEPGNGTLSPGTIQSGTPPPPPPPT